ncbi:hypothetical protein HEK616_83980 (plasmid) [Streptomyces nigrescens]|uniref:Uncharacterized protein n=1 Tax=Streptomyces nigrescens TaxID=1920 RepID=A0ABM8A8J6_STRNI|nr:hypothetical protein HEK616_83980 [Streptomyces nigrescens]
MEVGDIKVDPNVSISFRDDTEVCNAHSLDALVLARNCRDGQGLEDLRHAIDRAKDPYRKELA